MKARFIKIIKTTDPVNWWNHKDILGKTFEVIELSTSMVYGKQVYWAKIEYEKGFFGYIPLNMCEVNPHLKGVS